jgi:DNA repair protein RecO (recombination protein O)
VQRDLRLRAVVLRVVDYGERDRVVTLLTRERGRLSAFARGARTSRKRFGGALEPFTLLVAELRERGGELWTLDGVSVEEGFGAIRGDLARIACASYAVELGRELVREGEPHPDLFDLLAGYLRHLDAAPALPWDLRGLELSALRCAGLLPQLDDCARCGSSVGRGSARFDPEQGGVLCEACRGSASRAARDASPEVLEGLRRLRSGDHRAPPPAAAVAEARALLGACLEHHLGRRLAARRFLDEVGPLLGG